MRVTPMEHDAQPLTMRETMANWASFMKQTLQAGLMDAIGLPGSDPHAYMVRWSISSLSSVGVDLSIRGIEHVDPKAPQIFMANHQSNFDIFVLTAAIPVRFFWVYKHTLEQVPVMGSYLRRRGHIAINRGDRAKAIGSLGDAGKLIRQGKNITVFPEGTRSGTRELLPFKKGVFHLAFEAGVPIVPITINHCWKLMQKGSIRLHRTMVEVDFHPPISLEGLDPVEDFEVLRERVRETIDAGIV